MKLYLGAGAGAIVVGALLVAISPQAQEAEEAEQPLVAETEIQLYIDVYSAMQADHDLTIEAALAAHHMTVDRFREMENRIQREQRLVDRVRQTLLDQVKNRSVSALAPDRGPAPEATAAPERP